MKTTPELEAEIVRLHYAEHWRVGTIASQLDTHPDVVRRVLGIGAPRAPSQLRPRLVDPCVFRPSRSPKPVHGDHRNRSPRSERSDVVQSLVIEASSFRRDGPCSTIRWALWSSRSQTASATVGSPRYS